MTNCSICPVGCLADREHSAGACGVFGTDTAKVARAALHAWEEPWISGKNGSGTIFFAGCNLRCVFCQNHSISRRFVGITVDAELLARTMLALESLGAHNVNLVTPTPNTLLIANAIPRARELGLKIPIVYNTNGYETREALSMLDGLIDIYLPDIKYVTPGVSLRYSGRSDYFSFASAAVIKMYEQVGELVIDEKGLAVKGLAVRHLVLPGAVDETRRVLDFIAANLPKTTRISLMGQYAPPDELKASLPKPLDRPLLKREYARAIDYAISLGFENILVQELSSADNAYTPAFLDK